MPRGLRSTSAQELEVVIDPDQFGATLRKIRAFDPALAKSLRANLRKAGQVAVDDVKAELSKPTPSGGRNRGQIRGALKAGTKVSILTGAKKQGIRITTSGSRLPAGHEPMLRLYNEPSWRHPVFPRNRPPSRIRPRRGGSHGVAWVSQRGRPYFGAVIDQHKNEVARGVQTAIAEAIATMESR